MNRNQKIAIGCGAAGCLGLIVLAVLACVLFFVFRSPSMNSNRNRNANISRDFPSNSNSDSSANANASEAESSSSSMSDDDKHKLFQAGSATQDTEIVHRVWRKLGLMDADGTPNDKYAEFVKDHVAWLISNAEFAQSLNTPEKARAYVEAHIND
jgi:hypothetical protein